MASNGLRKWVQEKWVDIGAPKKNGKYQPCGRSKGSKRKYPKCVPLAKAKRMTAGQKKSAVARKRAAGNTGPKPTNVATFTKRNIRRHACATRIYKHHKKRTSKPAHLRQNKARGNWIWLTGRNSKYATAILISAKIRVGWKVKAGRTSAGISFAKHWEITIWSLALAPCRNPGPGASINPEKTWVN